MVLFYYVPLLSPLLLKLEEKKASRITFNEITKNAVKASLKEPRQLDMDLVNAQCNVLVVKGSGTFLLRSPTFTSSIKNSCPSTSW